MQVGKSNPHVHQQGWSLLEDIVDYSNSNPHSHSGSTVLGYVPQSHQPALRGQLLALIPCMPLQTGYRCGNQQGEPPLWETRCQSRAVGPPFGYVALDELLLLLFRPAPGCHGFSYRILIQNSSLLSLTGVTHTCDLPLASLCRKRNVLPCPSCNTFPSGSLWEPGC